MCMSTIQAECSQQTPGERWLSHSRVVPDQAEIIDETDLHVHVLPWTLHPQQIPAHLW